MRGIPRAERRSQARTQKAILGSMDGKINFLGAHLFFKKNKKNMNSMLLPRVYKKVSTYVKRIPKKEFVKKNLKTKEAYLKLTHVDILIGLFVLLS